MRFCTWEAAAKTFVVIVDESKLCDGRKLRSLSGFSTFKA